MVRSPQAMLLCLESCHYWEAVQVAYGGNSRRGRMNLSRFISLCIVVLSVWVNVTLSNLNEPNVFGCQTVVDPKCSPYNKDFYEGRFHDYEDACEDWSDCRCLISILCDDSNMFGGQMCCLHHDADLMLKWYNYGGWLVATVYCFGVSVCGVSDPDQYLFQENPDLGYDRCRPMQR